MSLRGMVELARQLVFVTTVCLGGVLGSVGPALAVVVYEEHWDAGDTNGAVQSTTASTVVRDDSVGNPAASIAVRRLTADPGSAIGVTTETAAFPYDLSGFNSVTASFDALYDTGGFTETKLRFRYHDSTFNGWYKVVATTFPAGWQTYGVTFDPTWTDVEASANGWVDETGGTISWAATMADIYHPEVRFELGDQNSAIAHVDNVTLDVIPEPASLALCAGASIVLLFRRSSRCF